jgi:hypothetical protein
LARARLGARARRRLAPDVIGWTHASDFVDFVVEVTRAPVAAAL